MGLNGGEAHANQYCFKITLAAFAVAALAWRVVDAPRPFFGAAFLAKLLVLPLGGMLMMVVRCRCDAYAMHMRRGESDMGIQLRQRELVTKLV